MKNPVLVVGAPGARQRARADHRVAVGQHPSLADVERAGVGPGAGEGPVPSEPLRGRVSRAVTVKLAAG